MSGLDAIPVRVEGAAAVPHRTENLRPLLQQIEQALQVLIEHGGEELIDLGSMPFSEQDERDLRETLGHGEVKATIDAFGPTLVEETGFPGVWLVEHKDVEGRRLTLHLEIARIPGMLITPEDDLVDGLAALRRANLGFSDAQKEDLQ